MYEWRKHSLLSYSDLADEIQALKIENNILKDKIKASKQPIKVFKVKESQLIRQIHVIF